MSKAVKAITSIASAVAPAIPVWGQVASLAFQGYSMLQERKQGKKAASAQREQSMIAQRAEDTKQRFQQAQAQRERIAQQRRARIQEGQIVAQTGGAGVGMGGTSGFTGAVGSIASQYGSNLTDINMGEGLSGELSNLKQQMAGAGNRQNEAMARQAGWQSMGTLASNLPGQIGNIFDAVNKTDKANT
jgi:hypothetical protein